jgi:hypothetical protein
MDRPYGRCRFVLFAARLSKYANKYSCGAHGAFDPGDIDPIRTFLHNQFAVMEAPRDGFGVGFAQQTGRLVHQPHESETRFPAGNKFAIHNRKTLELETEQHDWINISQDDEGYDQAAENYHETYHPSTSLCVRALKHVRTCAHKSKAS